MFLEVFNYLSVTILLVFILIYACKDSFLMILISMEFMVLVIIGCVFFLELTNLNEWIFLYYLIFSVCDSVLGMAIMISMIFNINSQNVSMINLMW